MAAAKTPQLELSLNCGRSEFLGHQKLFHFPPNTLVWWSCWVRTDPSWWISNNSIQHVQINFASGLYIYMYYILYTYICLHTYTHILRRKNPSPCFFGSAWAIPLNFSAERAMASLVIWFPDDLRDQQRTAHPQNASEWNENARSWCVPLCGPVFSNCCYLQFHKRWVS